jgi:hypothetical protein
MFKQHRSELETIARSFHRDDFRSQAEKLNQGECLYIPTFGEIMFINVFLTKPCPS